MSEPYAVLRVCEFCGLQAEYEPERNAYVCPACGIEMPCEMSEDSAIAALERERNA